MKATFLSTKKIIDFYLSYLSNSNVPLNVYRHGPCATAVFKSKYDFGNKLIPDEVHDHAQGFQICHVTKEGKRWLQIMDASTKERHWPLAKTIKKNKDTEM